MTRRFALPLVMFPLALALLGAAWDMPDRIAAARLNWPILQLWDHPAAQFAAQVPAADFLNAANAQLPTDATILLVGGDYVLYHRALHAVAPRPLWWTIPTTPDGAWQSRWWIPAPADPASIRAVAQQTGATYVVGYGDAPTPAASAAVTRIDGGYVAALTPATSTERFPADGSATAAALPVAGGVLLLFGLGSVGVMLARRFGLALTLPEALAVCWLVGAGLASLGMFLLNLLGVSLGWQVGLLSAVAVVCGVVCSRGVRRRRPEIKLRLDAFRVALLLLLALQTAIIALLAMGRHLTVWDSWVNWEMKARSIYLADGIGPAVYSDPSRAVTHLDYPLLFPLTQAWLYVFGGAADDRLAGLVSLLFYLALLALVYYGLRGLTVGPTLALAGTTLVGTLWQLAGLAQIVFADLPLAALATAAGLYLLRWLNGGPAGALVVAALAAGLLGWTKREGLVLLVALIVAALVAGAGKRRAWQAAGALAAAGIMLAGGWYVFVAGQGVSSPDFLPVSFNTLTANLGRGPTIARLELGSLLGSGFGFIWPAAVALLAVGFWRRFALMPLAAFLYVGLMAGSYFFSDFVPYEQHILSSVDRLAAQVAPLVAVWLVLVANTVLQAARDDGVAPLAADGTRAAADTSQ